MLIQITRFEGTCADMCCSIPTICIKIDGDWEYLEYADEKEIIEYICKYFGYEIELENISDSHFDDIENILQNILNDINPDIILEIDLDH